MGDTFFSECREICKFRLGVARRSAAAATTAMPKRFAERFRGVAGHPFETGFDLTLRPGRLN